MELDAKVDKEICKGGEFLIKETEAHSVFTPEDIDEEQVMFRSTAREFIETKVWPNVEKIDKGDYELVQQE